MKPTDARRLQSMAREGLRLRDKGRWTICWANVCYFWALVGIVLIVVSVFTLTWAGPVGFVVLVACAAAGHLLHKKARLLLAEAEKWQERGNELRQANIRDATNQYLDQALRLLDEEEADG